jgi:hypothetical protein
MPIARGEANKRYLEALKQMTIVDTASVTLVLGVQAVANLDPLWLVPAVAGSVLSLFSSLLGLFFMARQRVDEVADTQEIGFPMFNWTLGISMALFYGGLFFAFLVLLVIAAGP